ncbi:hypothetical protein E2C01_034816 [Portunus trituberculatus]|uniref:Uncharacterized protein n=1 Tax=Portunus trituberculatus TaxID=210409 RepID=A0A5B7F7M3_PORTR|nr:hypothetical protein [Portunus trituberculatus]
MNMEMRHATQRVKIHSQITINSYNLYMQNFSIVSWGRAGEPTL